MRGPETGRVAASCRMSLNSCYKQGSANADGDAGALIGPITIASPGESIALPRRRLRPEPGRHPHDAMDSRTEAQRQRCLLAEACLPLARELEAGRAAAPLQAKLALLTVPDPTLPVRAAVIAADPSAVHQLLSDIVGPDYNVCKVVVPSRLGYSEVLLQERGFLLDTGAGPTEFGDAASFVQALEQSQALRTDGDAAVLAPLRVQLKGAAHVSGLCLLVPQSLDALAQKPALLSTFTDQADWVFLVGGPETRLAAAQRQTLQVLLDHVTGLQNVLVPGAGAAAEAREEWWKGWKVTLSLGLVSHGTDLLRSRLALLTSPTSELRQYLVEARLSRQLETVFLLLEDEVQQAQQVATNRLQLGRDGLLGSAPREEGREQAEMLRVRLAEEADRIAKAVENDARTALAVDGAIHQQLKAAAEGITTDDIDQTVGETSIRLTLGTEPQRRMAGLVAELGRRRLNTDLQQIREGLECSVRDAEAALEKRTGLRHRLTLDLPDEETVWQTMFTASKPDVRYRGELPRPTLGSRFQSARQTIMGVMILGTLLGGIASLTGDEDSGVRTTLYALMLPLLVVGFLWTYVSFRRRERVALDKEVERLREGVQQELRRAQQELLREQQSALASAVQKAVRAVQQQIDGALARTQALRQREADEQRKRYADQQRALEQRVARLRQLAQQTASLKARHADLRKVHRQWLAAWIERFNQGKA